MREKFDIKETFEELFDKTIEDGKKKKYKGGFGLAPDLPESVGGRTPYHSKKYGKYRVGVRPQSYGRNDYEREAVQERYVSIIFHELFHRADIGSHKSLAQKAFNALTEEERKANPFPTEAYSGFDMDDTLGSYFSSLVNLYCVSPVPKSGSK